MLDSLVECVVWLNEKTALVGGFSKVYGVGARWTEVTGLEERSLQNNLYVQVMQVMREILFKLSGAVAAGKSVGQRARYKAGV